MGEAATFPVCFFFARENDYSRAVRKRFDRSPDVYTVMGHPDLPLFDRSGLAYFVPYTTGLESLGGCGEDTTAALRKRERILSFSQDSAPWLGVGSVLGVPADGGASVRMCMPVTDGGGGGGGQGVYKAFLSGLCLVEKTRRTRPHLCRGVICRDLERWGAGPEEAADQVFSAVTDFQRGRRPEQTSWHRVPDAFVCNGEGDRPAKAPRV